MTVGPDAARREEATDVAAATRRVTIPRGKCVTDDELVQRLLDDLYAAPGDRKRWTAFLLRWAAAAGGHCAALLRQDPGAEHGRIAAGIGFDAAYAAAYAGHYCRLNVVTRARASVSAGRVVTSDELVPAEDLIRTEFYNEFMRPQDQHHVLIGVAVRDNARTRCIDVVRSRTAGPFGAREVALATRLLPHMRRALLLDASLTKAARDHAAADDALDLLPLAVITVDSQGAAQSVNAGARAILAANDGLALARDGLRAATAAETSSLRLLVAAALSPGPVNGVERGGAMRLTRSSGRPAYEVLVTPLSPENAAQDLEGARAAVFIRDPARAIDADEVVLRRLYDLTRAEASLANLLLRGLGLDDAARSMQIALTTARTQLARVFHKTGARNQADLIRLLANSPAVLRFDRR